MKNEAHSSKSNQRKLFFKIGFILVLVLLLMIPNSLIQGLIFERQGLERNTQREIAADWGPSQKLMGPVLSIPFESEIIVDGEKSFIESTLRIVPDDVDITVGVETREKKKSIYKTILYAADHNIKGKFILPEEIDFGHNVKTIFWEKSSIDIGFSSATSLTEIVEMKWGDTPYKMQSGSSDNKIFSSAIHSNIIIDPSVKEYQFSTNIEINGSEGIKYLPLANNTSIKMNSKWNSPGFVGLPLPKHNIDDKGFTAEWKATEYNRQFKNIWFDNEVVLDRNGKGFGVDLVQTVGHYQKNMRSAKYALLIISLSFLVFFFFEMLKGSRIHPVQYIFVGLALSIFYALLLSLSEHIGFDLAYLAAAGAVVGLITWYSIYILKSGANTMVLSFILGGLYTYIYILLQMEEFALLVGSLGLFVALAITMYLSRNMDWYSIGTVTKDKLLNDPTVVS